MQLEQACKRVKGGQAKSCLACRRVKQRCVGSVWEGGDGLNRVPMVELTGLVRELVGEMKGFWCYTRNVFLEKSDMNSTSLYYCNPPSSSTGHKILGKIGRAHV